MISVLRIKPIGPARISQTPILSSSFIQASRDSTFGVPPPSTILGILGMYLQIKMERNHAARDPLLGLLSLTQMLEYRGLKTIAGRSLFLGPLVLIKGSLASPLQLKEATILVRIDSIGRILAENRINEDDPIAVSKLISSIGVGLRDYGPADYHAKTVMPGQTFRRSYTYLTMSDTQEPASYEYIIMVNFDREPDEINEYVRMGGRSRVARIWIEEAGEELLRLIDRVTSPCSGKASSGKYITLTPWPLLPFAETLYINESLEPRPKNIIGIPTLNTPKPRIIVAGLGYSEIAGVRRPLLPMIPPGTIIELDEKIKCPEIAMSLEKAGYYQIIKQ